MTGIGFDKKKTGELTSLAALWDTKFKGKITYLVDEMRDTVGLAAIKLGFDPAKITKDQFDTALAEIDRAVKGNLVVKPAADSSARLHQFRVLDATEEKAWNDAFSQVMGT